MPIKVNSTEEQYEYLALNWHNCGFYKKGPWKVLKQALTFELISQLTVECENCGYQTTFDFDVSSEFPEGSADILKDIKYKLYLDDDKKDIVTVKQKIRQLIQKCHFSMFF